MKKDETLEYTQKVLKIREMCFDEKSIKGTNLAPNKIGDTYTLSANTHSLCSEHMNHCNALRLEADKMLVRVNSLQKDMFELIRIELGDKVNDTNFTYNHKTGIITIISES